MTQPVSGDRHSGWESVLREDIILLNAAAAGSGWTVLEESHRKDAGPSWWGSLAAGASRLARGALERLGTWRTRASGPEEMGVMVVQAETIDAERASRFLIEDELVGSRVEQAVEQMRLQVEIEITGLAGRLLEAACSRKGYLSELAEVSAAAQALENGHAWCEKRRAFLGQGIEQLRLGQQALLSWMEAVGPRLTAGDRCRTTRRLDKMANEQSQLEGLLERETSVDWRGRVSAARAVIRDTQDRLSVLLESEAIGADASIEEMSEELRAQLANCLSTAALGAADPLPTQARRVAPIAEAIRNRLDRLRTEDGVGLSESAQLAILRLASQRL